MSYSIGTPDPEAVARWLADEILREAEAIMTGRAERTEAA